MSAIVKDEPKVELGLDDLRELFEQQNDKIRLSKDDFVKMARMQVEEQLKPKLDKKLAEVNAFAKTKIKDIHEVAREGLSPAAEAFDKALMGAKGKVRAAQVTYNGFVEASDFMDNNGKMPLTKQFTKYAIVVNIEKDTMDWYLSYDNGTFMTVPKIVKLPAKVRAAIAANDRRTKKLAELHKEQAEMVGEYNRILRTIEAKVERLVLEDTLGNSEEGKKLAKLIDGQLKTAIPKQLKG